MPDKDWSKLEDKLTEVHDIVRKEVEELGGIGLRNMPMSHHVGEIQGHLRSSLSSLYMAKKLIKHAEISCDYTGKVDDLIRSIIGEKE